MHCQNATHCVYVHGCTLPKTLPIANTLCIAETLPIVNTVYIAETLPIANTLHIAKNTAHCEYVVHCQNATHCEYGVHCQNAAHCEYVVHCQKHFPLRIRCILQKKRCPLRIRCILPKTLPIANTLYIAETIGVNRPAFGGTVPHFHQMCRVPRNETDVPHF